MAYASQLQAAAGKGAGSSRKPVISDSVNASLEELELDHYKKKPLSNFCPSVR